MDAKALEETALEMVLSQLKPKQLEASLVSLDGIDILCRCQVEKARCIIL